MALLSVIKLVSSSFGVPKIDRILASWSLVEHGKPLGLIITLASYYAVPGEIGKHDSPGKSGFLSKKVGECSYIQLMSSANMQPTAQRSMAGP